jgi:hypothetical protein
MAHGIEVRRTHVPLDVDLEHRQLRVLAPYAVQDGQAPQSQGAGSGSSRQAG